MTSESKPPEPIHVLSNKSYRLRRDTFVFWPNKPPNLAKLLVGLNQKITPVTSAKLHRWIRIVAPKLRDFDLRPVKVRKVGVFTYATTPVGPIVSSVSTLPLPPGDYGWYYSDGHQFPPTFVLQSDRTFADAKQFAEKDTHPDWPDLLKLYAFPPSFEESVLLRDRHCFITGTKGSPEDPCLAVSWVVPPAWIFKLIYPVEPSSSDIDRFITIANASVMQRDVMDLFHDNAFGIDVDDDYRIVIFRDIGSVSLPSKFNRDPTSPGPDDEFIRHHFAWCLRTQILGGDIQEDYDHNDVACAWEELGLGGENNVLVPLDDPRWQSPMGKELLEFHMRTQRYEYPDSDSDE